MRLPLGWTASSHSMQVMLTRDSEISMRRYCCRQSRHERCRHDSSAGNSSAGDSARHTGHSAQAGGVGGVGGVAGVGGSVAREPEPPSLDGEPSDSYVHTATLP